MVKDAEANKAEDEKRKAVVEARNKGDSLVHSTEKALSEHGDKVSAEEKGAIETAINALKEALKSDDVTDIEAKTNALSQAAMKLGEAMYKAQQESAAGADAQADGAKPAEDNVVDADYEEVDENKK